jgi:hypothetical protein
VTLAWASATPAWVGIAPAQATPTQARATPAGVTLSQAGGLWLELETASLSRSNSSTRRVCSSQSNSGSSWSASRLAQTVMIFQNHNGLAQNYCHFEKHNGPAPAPLWFSQSQWFFPNTVVTSGVTMVFGSDLQHHNSAGIIILLSPKNHHINRPPLNITLVNLVQKFQCAQ